MNKLLVLFICLAVAAIDARARRTRRIARRYSYNKGPTKYLGSSGRPRTRRPTSRPTSQPTISPTACTNAPTTAPTAAPTAPTAAPTLFLSIQLKNAPAAIDAAHLSSLTQTLPHLISSVFSSEFKQYIQVISTQTTYDAVCKIAIVNVYFPSVPVSAQGQVKNLLNIQISPSLPPSLYAPLSAILPGYLCVSDCEFDSIKLASTDDSPPEIPPTSAPPVAHIVGLKMLFFGTVETAYTVETVDDELVTAFQAALPGIIEEQINITGLPENTKNVLKDFVKKVDITQELIHGMSRTGLYVYASFSSIPAGYIDMYAPLFNKYVMQNKEFLAVSLPKTLNCTTCTFSQFELLNDVTPSPSVPTLKPTPKLIPNPTTPGKYVNKALPTLTPAKKPTLTPTVSPTLKPTASPTLKPTVSPSASPTKSPTNDLDATSSVSTLTPAHAFLVVLVGAAALV